jgi:uncharacterized protein YdeI (YjbR/CyaY-like superfamily)
VQITETFYTSNRLQWRHWLAENHKTAKDIWLIYYRKNHQNPRIPYDDAVEEALCFGWIDSTVKKIDENQIAQRFSPRRKNSLLSEPNKLRVRKMISAGLMTQAGIESIKKQISYSKTGEIIIEPYILPEDILEILKKEPTIWNNFQNFSEIYKNVRIAFIDGARKRPEIFNARLNYFMKMTSKNKKYGSIQ